MYWTLILLVPLFTLFTSCTHLKEIVTKFSMEVSFIMDPSPINLRYPCCVTGSVLFRYYKYLADEIIGNTLSLMWFHLTR